MDVTIRHGVLPKKSMQKENVYKVGKEPQKDRNPTMNNLNGGK